ncbi:hypothetical protein DUNSADRAFT_620 [Dunaliella salina]|uniref:Uncharacterized protein n=1 Tax=Dunaliella salina TaxID=3046 RepID=A0ABQ7FYP1_DUNSA|nr:hypothetical protein DUNSADRAFT_620 [Dunaliella salina]|eukprot:KAF5827459.1 hypothetical protein DUNSADRAFT_620 [Dunaliella salina]
MGTSRNQEVAWAACAAGWSRASNAQHTPFATFTAGQREHAGRIATYVIINQGDCPSQATPLLHQYQAANLGGGIELGV